MATSEGRVPGSMYDVLYLVNEAGYRLENLNPTAEGYYFAWDSEGQKIVYIREDLDTVIYPEDYTIDKSKCWITVGDKEEAERVANAGYNLYLEKNIDLIELHNVAVSIDTGAFTLGSLVVDGQAVDQKSVVLSGNFGSTSLNIGNASFSSTGHISSLNVGSNTAAMSINGNVGTFSSSINNTTMSQTGAIGSITSGSVSNTAGTTFTSTSGSVSGAIDGKVTASTKEDIENIRTQLANGRNFSGETITLANDINMAGIAFQPVSNYDRDHKKATDTKNWFQGTFDGQGHTIRNFSSTGFSVAGLNSATNDSSVKFHGVTYNEAVYGLFGAVYVPAGETVTIKNLNIEAAIDMIKDDANKYVGDSVGGLIGFAYGKGTLVIDNVTINGVINGYDGCAAFIGRAYAEASTFKIEFVDCTNNAAVNSVRKSGAFLGSSSGITSGNITYNNCVNNGNVTCYGIAKDMELETQDSKGVTVTGTVANNNGTGYYRAGAAQYDDAPDKKMSDPAYTPHLPSGFTNHGTIKIGEQTVNY